MVVLLPVQKQPVTAFCTTHRKCLNAMVMTFPVKLLLYPEQVMLLFMQHRKHSSLVLKLLLFPIQQAGFMIRKESM